jgi:hypothetical protein
MVEIIGVIFFLQLYCLSEMLFGRCVVVALGIDEPLKKWGLEVLAVRAYGAVHRYSAERVKSFRRLSLVKVDPCE